MLRRLRSSEGGYVLVLALVGLAVMAILAAGATRQATSAVRTAEKAIRAEQAQYLAEAGVQRVVAAPPVELPEGETATFRASNLDPELDDAFYVVTVEREGDYLLIESVGTAARGRNREERRVRDRLFAPLPDPGGEDPGNEDPGGEDPGGEDPGGEDPGGEDPGGEDPGNQPILFKYTLWTDDEVQLSNTALVCGDIVTTSTVEMSNSATVWGTVGGGANGSTCKSVGGSGTVVAAGSVSLSNTATIQGTVLSSGNVTLYNSATIRGKAVSSGKVTLYNSAQILGGHCKPGQAGCPPLPGASEIRPPKVDLAGLKAQADEWWVKRTFDCAGLPQGAKCKVIGTNGVVLEGFLEFSEPTIIYVDGNLSLSNNKRLDIKGPVTFVVNGSIQFSNSSRLTCTGKGGPSKAYCPIGLVSTKGVTTSNSSEVHAFIHTDGKFIGANSSTVYGNVVANSISTLANSYVQHGFSQPVGEYPPGLQLQFGGFLTDP